MTPLSPVLRWRQISALGIATAAHTASALRAAAAAAHESNSDMRLATASSTSRAPEDGMVVVCGFASGVLEAWPVPLHDRGRLEADAVLTHSPFAGSRSHMMQVSVIDTMPGQPLVLTGSFDRTIALWTASWTHGLVAVRWLALSHPVITATLVHNGLQLEAVVADGETVNRVTVSSDFRQLELGDTTSEELAARIHHVSAEQIAQHSLSLSFGRGTAGGALARAASVDTPLAATIKPKGSLGEYVLNSISTVTMPPPPSIPSGRATIDSERLTLDPVSATLGGLVTSVSPIPSRPARRARSSTAPTLSTLSALPPPPGLGTPALHEEPSQLSMLSAVSSTLASGTAEPSERDVAPSKEGPGGLAMATTTTPLPDARALRAYGALRNAYKSRACGTRKLAVRGLPIVLRAWWPDRVAVSDENVQSALNELGVSPQDKIGFDKLCEIAAVIVRVVGACPLREHEGAATLARSGGGWRRVEKLEREPMKKFNEMNKACTRVTFNAMGEPVRNVVGLETTGGRNSQWFKKHAKSKVPSSTVMSVRSQQPSFSEVPAPLNEMWMMASSGLDAARTRASNGKSGPRRLELNRTLEVARNLIDSKAMEDVVGSQAGGQPKSLAESVYNAFVNQFGKRSIAEARLVTLMDSISRFYHVSAFLRTFGRFLGVSAQDELTTKPVLSEEMAVLFIKGHQWLKEHGVLRDGEIVPRALTVGGGGASRGGGVTSGSSGAGVDATDATSSAFSTGAMGSAAGNVHWQLVTRRHAAICARELLTPADEQFAPCVLSRIIEAFPGLPDIGGSVGPHTTLSHHIWERYVDCDRFLEELIESVLKSDETASEAEKTLFSTDGPGKVIAPRTENGGGGPIRHDRLGDAFWKWKNALAQMKNLLNHFIGHDDQRTGCIEAPLFCDVLRNGLPEVWDSWTAPKLPADEDALHPCERVLQMLLVRFRDPFDNAVCYLDFWAMLHTEVLLHRCYPPFEELYDRASSQMIGIDGPQLEALRLYVQHVRVAIPRSVRTISLRATSAPTTATAKPATPSATTNAPTIVPTTAPPRDGGKLSTTGHLNLHQRPAHPGPGTMTISRPPTTERTPIERVGERRATAMMTTMSAHATRRLRSAGDCASETGEAEGEGEGERDTTALRMAATQQPEAEGAAPLMKESTPLAPTELLLQASDALASDLHTRAKYVPVRERLSHSRALSSRRRAADEPDSTDTMAQATLTKEITKTSVYFRFPGVEPQKTRVTAEMMSTLEVSGHFWTACICQTRGDD